MSETQRKQVDTQVDKAKVNQDSISDYRNQEWYKNLSPEQQKSIDLKIEQKKELEWKIKDIQNEIRIKWVRVDIMTSKLDKNRLLVQDEEDNTEIKSFEERIDTMNRDIDFLSRELYKYKLELNSSTLMNSFEKSNTYFKKGLLNEWETDDSLKKIVESKDLSNITAWEIYAFKQAWYDLSKMFLIWAWEVSKEKINIWDKFKVNFWWNNSLNKSIWAWDLLPIDNIDKVKINWIVWERKLSPRPWYYWSDWKYLAVFDNYDIEILSKKDFNEEEQTKSFDAFKSRYEEIRKPEVLTKFREQINNTWTSNEIKLEWFSKVDLELFWTYLSSFLPKETASNIKFDAEKWQIISTTWEPIKDVVNKFVPTENLWNWYEKYKDIVIEVSNKYDIRPEKLITLINHENRDWDPMAWAPWSSAYGLWQMIDSTWATYGKWLDRNNPKDQLEATCKYLVAIMDRKDCTIELAMAYYNTWEGIMSISQSKAQEFARINPAINKKIPSWEIITPKTYLIWAVAYYNDIDFKTASTLV